MKFSCCLNMAFTWQSLSGPWFLCMTLHRKALRPWLIISLMPLFAKTLRLSMTLWRRYDVRKFDADAILFREILSKKRVILMFNRWFQCGLGSTQVKYARITIPHVCFIALTLAVSLERCFNTWPEGLVFKQLPRDLANVNAWKNMCDPYIFFHFSQVRLINPSKREQQNSYFSGMPLELYYCEILL